MVWHDDVNQVYAKLIVPTRAPLQASMATEAGLAKTARLVACVKPVRTLIHHLWFAATVPQIHCTRVGTPTWWIANVAIWIT